MDLQKEDSQISELISQVDASSKDNKNNNSMPPPNKIRAGNTNSGDQASSSFPRPGSRTTSSNATTIGTKRTRSVASSSSAANKNERGNTTSSNSTASAFGISGNRTKNNLSSSTSSNVSERGGGGPSALSSARINVGGDNRSNSSTASKDEKDANKLIVPEIKQKVLPQRVTRATTGPGTPTNSVSGRKNAGSNVSSGLRRLGGTNNTSSMSSSSTAGNLKEKNRSTSGTSEKKAGSGKLSSSTSSNKLHPPSSSASSSTTTTSVSRKKTGDSNASSSETDTNTTNTRTTNATSSNNNLTSNRKTPNPSSSQTNSTNRENQTSSSSVLAKLQKDKENKIMELKSQREKEFSNWQREKEIAIEISKEESRKWKKVDEEILKLIRSLAGAFWAMKWFRGEKALKFLRLRQEIDPEVEEEEVQNQKRIDKGKGKEKENQTDSIDQSQQNELYKAYVNHLTGSIDDDEQVGSKLSRTQQFELFGEGIPRLIKNSFPIRILLGKIYHDLSKYQLSEIEFSYSRKFNPYNPQLMDLYSTVLYHLNRETLLSSLSQELILLNPTSYQGQIAAGNAFSLQSSHELALRCFRRSILLDSSQSYNFTLAGYESIELGMLEEAMSLFRMSIRNDRNHWNAYAGLGKCFMRVEKWEYARECYEIAIGINRNNSALWELLGTVSMIKSTW